MIDRALDFIVKELNEYFDLKIGGKPVILTNLGDSSTGQNPLSSEHVGCSLVNIEEERNVRNKSAYTEPVNGVSTKKNPEVMLQLFLVFAVNPDNTNYLDTMKMLSHVIAFFQGRNMFTAGNAPRLDSSLERIHMDLYSIPIEQQNYLWSGIGAKYLPSVLYRMRMVSIIDDNILGSGPGIEQVQTLTTGQQS